MIDNSHALQPPPRVWGCHWLLGLERNFYAMMICGVPGVRADLSVRLGMKAGKEFWCKNTRGNTVFHV